MIGMGRREILAMIGAAPMLAAARGGGGQTLPLLGRARTFSWDVLRRQAAALATRSYRAPAPVNAVAAQDYDTTNALRYRAEATIGDAVRLLPLSRTAAVPIRLHLIEGGGAREILFSPDLFETKDGHGALGIAGFRALNPGHDSDWLAFLGASYFRSAGSENQFGLSARAIAIDTGIDGREEFPTFTTFWIEPHGRERLVVYALLDGQSVTGGFRFDSRLTADGVVQDVASTLHFRRDVTRLGIAPSTSMFWYGEGDRAAAVDWRPEIHDSDGLAILGRSGERTWRPLVNPRTPTFNTFLETDPMGFGLIQRDRDFDHYQDDGAFYHRRPNLWVEPKGRWGRGAVSLYVFPTDGETTDNVVSFWTPEAAPRAGAALAFDYRLTWTSRDPVPPAPSRAVAVWTGIAGRPGLAPRPGERKLVIDFVGPALTGLDLNSGVVAHVDVTHGEIVESRPYPVLGHPDMWRVMVDVAPTGTDPAEVRLWIGRGNMALSETIVIPVN